MAPPALLLASLAASRRGGVTFAVAWPLAVDGALAAVERVEREHWALVFTEMREAWEAAFERQPATRRTRALATLIDDDREARDGRTLRALRRPDRGRQERRRAVLLDRLPARS